MILARLEKNYTGSTLARIAVEVLDEKEIKLLVPYEYEVDWNERIENEDPAILWSLKNDKFGMFDILLPVSKLNLQGDSSADLTIICGSETFRVHRIFFYNRSPVFRAMLDSPMREGREGEINIQEMDSTTLSSMIHYVYTGELERDWPYLDILDVFRAGDMYDLFGWVELFWVKLKSGEVKWSEEKMAEIRLAEDTFDIVSKLNSKRLIQD